VRERKSKKAGKVDKSKEKDLKTPLEENEQVAEVTPSGDHVTEKKLKKNKSKSASKKDGNSFLFAAFGKIKYIFLILFVPPFLNYASLQREAIELKPAGEQYDIGWGQKLFLSCQGQGPPTVVLDAPTGMSSDVWSEVASKLSKLANVCVYDRAGIGFSDRPLNRTGVTDAENAGFKQADRWQPFTAERMVDDLRKLITSSSQQPTPVILVGAELGAVVSQFYAHIYEQEILGLVLVNPLPDEIFQQAGGLWSQHWFNSISPTYQTLQLGAAMGYNRLGLLMGAVNQPITGKHVAQDVVTRQKYLLCHPRHLSSVVDEHYFVNETLSQLRTLRLIKPLASNISVSVLTGNYYDEQMAAPLNKAWASAEQKLLTRYFRSAQHLVVNGADRHMMYRKPEAIIEAVTKLIKRWKKSQKTNILKGSQSS